ncbi:MAG: YesL family protein [Lachnospiraceae bacterium]|nr:YesL family protein [Lachnospiraceae bacterium]
MNSLFNMDGPVMSFLNRVADLIWLNILALICCLPIVTAGASLTALHYMTIKMVKKEEGYIARGFFKSFRQNFKQATIIWMMVLLVGAVIWGDLFILNRMLTGMPKAFSIIIAAVGVIFLFTFIYVFPVLARFDNTIKNTIKNAFLMSILNFPKTILMVIVYVIPVVVMFLVPAVFPVVFMLGMSLPAYVASIFFAGIFKKFEPEELTDEIEEE